MKELHDCKPTLTDTAVLEFCKQGYLALEAVVSEDINQRARAFLETHTSYEPTEILLEDWFVEGVVKNPQAAGAMRSLLGENFGLPILMSNHRGEYPAGITCGWHRDGGAKHTHEFRNLQVFYLPQDCSREQGPTELLPWSHFLYSPSNYMVHLDRVKGTRFMEGPAGSIFITIYSIWHRRAPARSQAKGVRNLLKYAYFRNTPPKRDWILEPDFDFATANYSANDIRFRVQFRDAMDAAEMFLWLCGKHDRYYFEGGQTWPLPMEHRLDKPYGVPAGL